MKSKTARIHRSHNKSNSSKKKKKGIRHPSIVQTYAILCTFDAMPIFLNIFSNKKKNTYIKSCTLFRNCLNGNGNIYHDTNNSN